MTEEIDGYGEESDDWMDVGERKEYIDMSESPGSFQGYFTGKPIKRRSKFGKDQYHFPVSMVIDTERGTTGERILSTGSSKLRSSLKQQLDKYPDLLKGKLLVHVQWTGAGLDRSYDCAVVSDPWN